MGMIPKISFSEPGLPFSADLLQTAHPAKVFGWNENFSGAHLGATFFGFSLGATQLTAGPTSATLPGGSYFAAVGEVSLRGGRGFVAELPNYTGLPSVGGPIEATGRLRYIDGCTDTLLIAPPRRGDPCLNLLHFPPGVLQTQHTHPSVRVGVVVRGRGVCHSEMGDFPLVPGTVFYMLADTVHGFETRDEEMVVVAWHPDSDTGPSDDDHPMVNRTMVGGVSASKIEEIRTRPA